MSKPNLLKLTKDKLDSLPWKPHQSDGRISVDIVILYDTSKENSKGSKAALLRYHPNAVVPTHIHQGYELVHVLEGVLEDSNGSYDAGSCLVFEPGSEHKLWSKKGCVFFVIWEMPVKLKT